MNDYVSKRGGPSAPLTERLWRKVATAVGHLDRRLRREPHDD
jgi:hypothetical protein